LEVEVVVEPVSETETTPGCATDVACLDKLAQRLEVDHVLFLVVAGAGGPVRVDFSHLVRGGREVAHPPALILDPDASKRQEVIAAASRDLVPGADARPSRPADDGDGTRSGQGPDDGSDGPGGVVDVPGKPSPGRGK